METLHHNEAISLVFILNVCLKKDEMTVIGIMFCCLFAQEAFAQF